MSTDNTNNNNNDNNSTTTTTDTTTAAEMMNKSADYWFYDIGVNVFRADTKNRANSFKIKLFFDKEFLFFLFN